MSLWIGLAIGGCLAAVVVYGAWRIDRALERTRDDWMESRHG